jgi:hypothetical protein
MPEDSGCDRFEAASTFAGMPARIASGSSGQAATMDLKPV